MLHRRACLIPLGQNPQSWRASLFPNSTRLPWLGYEDVNWEEGKRRG